MPEIIYPFKVIHSLEESNDILDSSSDPVLVYAISGWTSGLEAWPYPHKEEYKHWPDGPDHGLFIEAVVSLRVGDRVCWLDEERTNALIESLKLSLDASKKRQALIKAEVQSRVSDH